MTKKKKINLNSYSLKKKIIGKNKSKIKSKKIINKSEKERMNEKEKEGSIISDHTVSISAEAFKDSISK
jgi:hypothetical protein